MNPLAQFAAGFLGALFGFAIFSLFAKRGNRHPIRGVCVALAVAFMLPIYKWLFDAWKYGILLLPLVGGVLGGVGYILGCLIEGGVKRPKKSD
jgi:hypothetical protein